MRAAHSAGPRASSMPAAMPRHDHQRDQGEIERQVEAQRERRQQRDLGEPGARPHVHRDGEGGAGESERGALQHLAPNDGGPARAHRQMNRHVPPGAGRAREQDAADIRGRSGEDQQAEAGKNPRQPPHDRALVSGQHGGGCGLQPALAPGLGMPSRQVRGRRVEATLNFCQAPRRQREGGEPAVVEVGAPAADSTPRRRARS